jgi:hypothetical protein
LLVRFDGTGGATSAELLAPAVKLPSTLSECDPKYAITVEFAVRVTPPSFGAQFIIVPVSKEYVVLSLAAIVGTGVSSTVEVGGAAFLLQASSIARTKKKKIAKKALSFFILFLLKILYLY